jgi:class 3 adenylate cyclase
MVAIGRGVVVLAAEVVGRSGLIETDKEATFDRLEVHRDEFLYPKIAEHRGRVVRATGDDSLLVEFASPTDAVRCAVEVQQGMIDHEIGVTPDRRTTYRIGIDIGGATANRDDLVIRAVAALPVDELATLIKSGADAYRKNENVAVLLSASADPGGLCISNTVWAAIRDELSFPFEDIGEQHLGIRASPVHCYKLSASAVAAIRRGAGQHRPDRSSRGAGLRVAAGVGGVFATFGICGVALWAWLAATSSTVPIPAPATIGSDVSSISSTADRDRRAPSAPEPAVAIGITDTTKPPSSTLQPAVANDTAVDREVQARLDPQGQPASKPGVDRDAQTPSAWPPQPDTGAVVIRGRQAMSALQATPDSAAVVRGAQAPPAQQTVPAIATAVVKGNQASSMPQREPDAGAVVRGSRPPSGLAVP